MSLDTFVLDRPFDAHLHLREGAVLPWLVQHSAASFAGALVMPNLQQPLTTLDGLCAYEAWILHCLDYDHRGEPRRSPLVFAPRLTLFFRTDYSADFLRRARPFYSAVKFYPRGMTTNADHGVDPADPAVDRVLGHLEELDVPLCVHGEAEGFVLDRERVFYHQYLAKWAHRHPKLRIVLEHVSSRAGVDAVYWHPNVHCTVTPQHLLGTLDDLAGGLLDPHAFCKPLLKTPADREAIQAMVLHNEKAMLGTDSAPHPIDRKESAGGCAGCFTAPIALPLLADFFARESTPQRFQAFVSDTARAFYRLDLPAKTVRLVRRDMVVPEAYPLSGPADVLPNDSSRRARCVRPLWAGRTLPWSIEEIP